MCDYFRGRRYPNNSGGRRQKLPSFQRKRPPSFRLRSTKFPFCLPQVCAAEVSAIYSPLGGRWRKPSAAEQLQLSGGSPQGSPVYEGILNFLHLQYLFCHLHLHQSGVMMGEPCLSIGTDSYSLFVPTLRQICPPTSSFYRVDHEE